MTRTDRVTITPIRVAELLAEDGRMPVFVPVIDSPDGRVLGDTGMTGPQSGRAPRPSGGEAEE